MDSQQWIERYEKVQWNTFGRRRLVLARGEGSRVWDLEGREYLDFLSGIAVNNLGHCHPAIVEAVRKQAGELMHCTNLYYIPIQIQWAEMLIQHAFGGKVFLSNSGAEANEAMIKLARKYASLHFDDARRTIVCTNNSFHGRTMNTLSATGQDKVKVGYDPLMPGFKFVDFNDIKAMKAAVDKKVCAIMVEPIQGEGGVRPATQEFMDALDAIRKETGVLLLFDEVQTGLGRTGRNFAYEHYNIIPDVLSLAKPLAGGLAAGATIARDEVAEAMGPGSHGSTMGGNPMASAAGHAYCKILFEEHLAERAAQAGEMILSELRDWVEAIPCVQEIRGKGLMIGIQLDRPGMDVVTRCEENGLLINCTAGNVVRMLPPLNVEEEDVQTALTILRDALEAEK